MRLLNTEITLTRARQIKCHLLIWTTMISSLKGGINQAIEKKIFRIGADKRIGWQQCSFFSYEICSIEIKGILGKKKT